MKIFKSQLAVYFTFILLFLIVLKAIVYFEAQVEHSNIKDFSDGLWYAIVTLTTVGYGDFYPVTPVGKILGLLVILSSLGVLGFLIAQLSSRINSYLRNKKYGLMGTDFEKHFIIIGWDAFGKQVVDQIVSAQHQVAIVTDQKNDIDQMRTIYTPEQVFGLFNDLGNPAGLEKANIRKATKVFINLKDDSETLINVINTKKLYPDTQFVILLNSMELKETFTSIGVEFIVSKNEIASKLVASYIFEPDVASFTEDLMETTTTEENFDILQYRVTTANPYLNKDYMEVFLQLKEKYNSVLLGISKSKDGKEVLIKNPKSEQIEKDDYLIVMANNSSKILLKEAFQVKEGKV